MGNATSGLNNFQTIMPFFKRLHSLVKSPARLWRWFRGQIKSSKKATSTGAAEINVQQTTTMNVDHLTEAASGTRDNMDPPTEITQPPIGVDIAIGHHEVESLNQRSELSEDDDAQSESSASGSVDSQVNISNTQLSSIPPQPVAPADGPSALAGVRIPDFPVVQRNSLPSSSLSLVDFISCLPLEHRLEQYLQIKDIINLGRISPELEIVVLKDFLQDYIISNSYITLRTKHVRAGSRPRESLPLYPVIRRRDKLDRVLPDGRVVYEPDYNNFRPSYRPGKYAPDEIEFHLPIELHRPSRSRSTPYRWPLGENQVGRPYQTHDTVYREERNAPSSNMSVVQGVFYKFRNEMSGEDQQDDFPVNVFYKREGDSEAAKLHAVSIPWECLLDRLLVEPVRLNGNNRRRNNGRHGQ